jgi:hypothetical protein
MNRCLLAKWIFKIESGEDNICCNLLRKKYLGNGGFFGSQRANCSQFWKSLQDVKGDCFRGFRYIIGDCNKARFWHDLWLGNCPFKIRFPHIFEVCNQQDWSVNRVCNQDNILLSFRRNLGEREESEFAELLGILEGLQLSNSKDVVKWDFEKTGIYSTSSLYNKLTFTRFHNR